MDIFDIGEGLDGGMEEGFSKVKCPSLVSTLDLL